MHLDFGRPAALLAFFCSLFLLLAQIAVAQTPIGFLAPRGYDGGRGFAAADFNGDGYTDVVSAKADRLNLLRGGASGVLREPATTVFACAGFSSTALTQVFAADFTGDGRIDLAAFLDDSSCSGRGLRAVLVLPGNADGTFAAPVFTDVNNFFFSPNKFASADFNGDGRPDLALGIGFSGTGDRVAIFLNQGGGTFAAPVSYETGSMNNFNLVAADFTGDNRAELVIARFPFDLAIMRNNGDGTFAAPQTIAAGVGYDAATVADFNNDGKADLLASRPSNNRPVVETWLGVGDGTFTAGPALQLSAQNASAAFLLAGDFTGEGNQDAAVSLVGRTVLLRGNGQGALIEDDVYGVGGGRLFKGDFNRDGRLDLGLGQSASNVTSAGTAGEFAISLNEGDGRFFAAPWSEIPFGGAEIAVADFNGDNLRDVALTGDSFNGEIAVILQEPLAAARGGKAQPQQLQARAAGQGITPRTIAEADFNRDGKRDLVVAGNPPQGATENVVVARNDGAANFTLFSTMSLAGTIVKVVAADFNGDQIPDLAFAVNRETLPATTPALLVARGTGTGTFLAPVGYLPNAVATGLAAGDFNNDNRPDLAVILNTGGVSVMLNNGTGDFAFNASYNLPSAGTDIETADLDGDGRRDLIVASNTSFIANTARVSVLKNTGGGAFAAAVNYPTLWLYPQQLAVGDFNGDGRPDVAVTNNALVTVFANDGSGGLTDRRSWAAVGGLRDIAAADFDNDQKTDLVVTSGFSNFLSVSFLPNATTGRAAVFDFDGDGKTDVGITRPTGAAGREWWTQRSTDQQTTALQFGVASDRPTPADYTGDGKTDVAFFRPQTGEWFVLRSEDFTFYAFPFGQNGDVPVTGDFDADGKADTGVFRPSVATWFIVKSSGGTIITAFGTPTDKPVVADYDGDGKADIAIYRNNNGASEWWIQRSSDLQVAALQFGATTDKAVPGDYTGDGKADVAFFRPQTGEWFILRSENGSFYAFPFGGAGDISVPGDYDGDGKTDAAVFRPSTTNWFVQRSTAGTLITAFGASSDVPIPSVYTP